MKKQILKLHFVIVLVTACFLCGNAQTIISGHIFDESTNTPLEGVKIEAKGIEGGPIALTDANGKYTIVISEQVQVTLYFSKENYETSTDLLVLNEKNLSHDKKLKLLKLNIQMTNFKKNDRIEGKIFGLKEENLSDFKLVVYVLTDKWYIHPYAENRAGRGYALIESGGNWNIETVWRGYQAYKVAFLLVDRNAYTPSTINNGSDKALLNEIENKAYSIIDAPEGI